jgi:hypothetical protein
MPYQVYKVVNFPSDKAGLTTVGYTVEGQRRTAGVADLGGGSYGALVVFNQPGPIVWDTGGASPVRTSDALNPTPTIGEIADAVWDEPRSGHLGAGTFGESLEVESSYGGGVQSATATTVVLGSNEPTSSDYKNWGVSIHSGKGAGQYRTLTAYTPASRSGTVDRAWDSTPDATSVYKLWPPVSVSLNSDKSGYALTTVEHGLVAGDVWNSMASSFNTAGTFGARLNVSGGGGGLSASQVAAAVWDEPRASHTVTGTFGAYLDVAVSSRSTYAGGAVASVVAPVTVGINNDKSGYILGATGLDAISVEVGVNARQALAPILAASAGVLLGAGTGTIVIKGGNSATTRITATTDNAGNRTAVTLSLPS